ncbi:TIGR04282 family arsenosugar biosynthesis glycosyltransferase [Fontimonas sp. SYSU GA230001]|uniref:TIGR04282 family arsenosugar biosynthesis glycosyltransferase n=1 Tax=Fontimonas sp. SYSU GA230001 TaxID=3142450 RepID=UPI0032B5279C
MAAARFAVGVMARAPVPGQAKTRLIPALGAEGAARLQRRLTLHALQTATAAAPGAVTLFTAGDPDHPLWTACRRQLGVTIVAQHGDHLGERMLHALQTLLRTHERAALTGTDCPLLEARHLAGLMAALGRARMAFIPAEDGGYVAVAAREPVAAAFGPLAWGTPAVMQQTRAALAGAGWRAGCDWCELPELWDIDRPEDLTRAQRMGLPVGCVD